MNWPLPVWLLGMENAMTFAFTQFLLLLPVLAVNHKYFKTGFRTLFHGAPNMDSLIAIGSGAATVYGIYAIYNIVGIPIAVGVFFIPFVLKLNPMIGAFAMSFSSVFVVTNALRLRWFKPKHTTDIKE